MNSTRNPQYAHQGKSNADVIPDIEHPSPQIKPLADLSKSIDDNASSQSQPSPNGKSSEMADPRGYEASLSTNHGSTHDQVKPADSMAMGASVMFMDVLETTETNAVSGLHGLFVIDGECHAYRRYQNSGFRSRQSQPSRQKKPQVIDAAIEANAGKSDDEGQEEADDVQRRRSGRKRKPVNPPHPNKPPGSKVATLEFLQPTRNCVIIELPDDAVPGDTFLVAWPKLVGEIEDAGSPRYFLCEVPETVSPSKKKKKRLLRVMAPDSYMSHKKQRSGGDRYKRGTPQKSSVRRAVQSPQKADWYSYQKSTSRVGKLYQVPVLPPACAVTKANDSDEAAVPGYETWRSPSALVQISFSLFISPFPTIIAMEPFGTADWQSRQSEKGSNWKPFWIYYRRAE